MNQRLQEVLTDNYGNYIMPFFWQHGASEAVLREYMGKIYECGIRAVCLEARPHPDFVGPQWWRDVDVVMDEARSRGMRVWILDDSHFPTGFANGAVQNAPDALKRWYLLEHTMNVDGPLRGWRFEVASHLGYDFFMGQMSAYKREELVAVIIGRRCEADGTVYYTDLQDVTDCVTDGWLHMDISEGNYCVFTYTKKLGAASKASDHISFLEKASVRLLIDTVYEPHYARYGNDFGTAFAGFFSDEPGFYNLSGQPFGMGKIGDPMPLPWSEGVAQYFYNATADGAVTSLPGLFHSLHGSEGAVRFAYMDIITRMYEENFSRQLGDWCQEHHVEYIGHVLEDQGLHSCLGPGTGHYFRAMSGQHMAGIDVVLNQLLPDQDYDGGTFYHYALPVLAASAAHQNSRMKGRAMCEIFGAFGWSEGLTMMKWMADHMLVNGINWFVPHAFSEKEFPDPDCPPHFYAHGNNPQYRHMHVLFNYMNRMSHLLNGGRAAVDVAVLFPAEGEWSGAYRPYDHLGRLLLQHQIPYELLCMDHLKQASVDQGRIVIGSASYKYLLVDHIAALPDEYIDIFEQFHAMGADIRFVGGAPVGFEGSKAVSVAMLEDADVLPLLHDCRVCHTNSFVKWLRCYRYVHEDLSIYMIANASMTHGLQASVALELPESCRLVRYNGLDNTLEAVSLDAQGCLSLDMEPGESFLLLVGDDLPQAGTAVSGVAEKISCQVQISLADYKNQADFKLLTVTDQLEDISLLKKAFSGVISYELPFTGHARGLELGCCYEAAQVFVNGQSAGTRICRPYRYSLEGLTVEGENRLCIEVATTLADAMMDGLSMARPVQPEGLMGPLTLIR